MPRLFLSEISVAVLIEDYTGGLLVRLLSWRRLFAAAAAEAEQRATTAATAARATRASCGWRGGVGAMLFTHSISLINIALLWHLCQAGRAPSFAGGRELWQYGGNRGGRKDRIRQPTLEKFHTRLLQVMKEIKRTTQIKKTRAIEL